MNRAAIDVGSNSLLLTIVDQQGTVLHDEARVVGLGRGLGDSGMLAPDRMKAAEVVLGEYVETAKGFGVEPWAVRAVTTSAARRAMNAETWVAHVQRTLGLKVRIVTGEEEANLTWKGSLRDLPLPAGPVLAVDLGGGSTELVLGTTESVMEHASLEIGSVRLTEEFLGTGKVDPAGLTRLRKWVDTIVDRFSFRPAPDAVIGVAGTVTTLSSMVLGLQRYDAAIVHGTKLSRLDLGRIVDQLLPAGPEERRALVPTGPDRADYLVAGATILDRVLACSGRSELLVSDRGLRFGLLAY